MADDLEPWIEKYKLAVDFAKAVEYELGEAQALTILGRVFNEQAVENGKARAKLIGNNTVEGLAEDLRKRAAARPTLEVLEATDSYIATKTTRCRACEAFAALGAPELCHLLCEADYAYIQAYNPNMTLVRTKTVADGDACCNHILVLTTGEDESEA